MWDPLSRYMFCVLASDCKAAKDPKVLLKKKFLDDSISANKFKGSVRFRIVPAADIY